MDWSGYNFLQSLTTVIWAGSEASGGGRPERRPVSNYNYNPDLFFQYHFVWSKQIRIYVVSNLL